MPDNFSSTYLCSDDRIVKLQGEALKVLQALEAVGTYLQYAIYGCFFLLNRKSQGNEAFPLSTNLSVRYFFKYFLNIIYLDHGC